MVLVLHRQEQGATLNSEVQEGCRREGEKECSQILLLKADSPWTARAANDCLIPTPRIYVPRLLKLKTLLSLNGLQGSSSGLCVLVGTRASMGWYT